MGGRCASRVAVANRLLGPDVLPAPRCHIAWQTLKFVDTDCVSNFSAMAAVKALWSWVNTVPLVDVELDSLQKTVRGVEDLSISRGGFKSELTQTIPVVNILMSNALLKAGSPVSYTHLTLPTILRV